MINLIRNILIVLMITVHFMSFNHAVRPTNEGFNKCLTNILYGFSKLYDIKDIHKLKGFIPDPDLFDPDSRLKCISSAILNMTEHETYNTDRKGYYEKFPGHVIPDRIDATEKFCTDNTSYSFPDFDNKKEYDKCIGELKVFGTDKGNILSLALRVYRITLTNEENKFFFWEGTYGNRYLRHISEVIELKPNSNLETPGEYCSTNHPDPGYLAALKNMISGSR